MSSRMKSSFCLFIVLIGIMLFSSTLLAVEERGSWWERSRKEAEGSGYALQKLNDVKTMMQNQEDLLLLDVRPHYEYLQGHLPNAVNLEFHLGDRTNITQEKKAALAKLLGADKNRRIVIYCRSYSCLRSAIASRWAVSLGYKNIMRMPVGYNGWQKANLSSVAKEEQHLLKKGDLFPKCSLTLLNPSADTKYLGVDSKAKTIRLFEIPAEFIYVEIFNELCLGCIEEIKNYKTIHASFIADEVLSKKIKLIGIEAGSKQRNVVKFRKTHDIPFPLFADVNWNLFECLGRPALPTSYLIRRINKEERKIMFVQRDHIEDINELLHTITDILRK